MIQMPVREDDGISRLHIRRQSFIHALGFVTGALEQAHIQENTQAIDFHQMG